MSHQGYLYPKILKTKLLVICGGVLSSLSSKKKSSAAENAVATPPVSNPTADLANIPAAKKMATIISNTVTIAAPTRSTG